MEWSSDQGQEEWGGDGGRAHLNCLGAGMSLPSQPEREDAALSGSLHCMLGSYTCRALGRLRLTESERYGHESLHGLEFLEENREVIYVLAFQTPVL